MQQIKMVKPDAKGRITLGHLTEGVSRFAVHTDEKKRIILEPFVEIPIRERWLFENKSALTAVKQGLKDVAKKRLHDKGSFSKYLKED